ncbi:unnamed protein product [Porites evermanni]|uniref:MULE transposase domain-containing protein n=1 Tax=Porites evermanni TaxID=104178 RepID=A0ABN8MCW9_9CNID|nr:unnamed protein product [Porites evermanni]
MSGRKKKDYCKIPEVLKEVLDLLPSSLSLKRITIDFEKALWSAIGQLLPDVDIRGCAFHMTQALWRKVMTHILTNEEQDQFRLISLFFFPRFKSSGYRVRTAMIPVPTKNDGLALLTGPGD